MPSVLGSGEGVSGEGDSNDTLGRGGLAGAGEGEHGGGDVDADRVVTVLAGGGVDEADLVVTDVGAERILFSSSMDWLTKGMIFLR